MYARRLAGILFLCALVLPILARRIPEPSPPPGPGRPRADAPGAAVLLFGGRLDVNQAGAADLAAVTGLGPARARKITAWRARHGPFRTVDDLATVPGIGPRTVAAARDSLTCAPSPRIRGESERPLR